MAIRYPSRSFTSTDRGMKYVSSEEGREILDRQARKYLGMSGEVFVREYRAGRIPHPDRSEVRLVAMLIPLTDA